MTKKDNIKSHHSCPKLFWCYLSIDSFVSLCRFILYHLCPLQSISWGIFIFFLPLPPLPCYQADNWSVNPPIAEQFMLNHWFVVSSGQICKEMWIMRGFLAACAAWTYRIHYRQPPILKLLISRYVIKFGVGSWWSIKWLWKQVWEKNPEFEIAIEEDCV